ncbi:MAG TPA: transcription antitermination factor NusB [Gemmatimonadales bacterium]|jgi:N utilization substance protein B|nr:transcription antitermination factor NusB [Gemmatimonadales bacterium]
MMLRVETRRRARALQLLYALETTGDDIDVAARNLVRLTGPEPDVSREAHDLVHAVLDRREELDQRAEAAAEHWRFDRIALVERNILRLGIYELVVGDVPARVVIDESLWLAHRFASLKAPPFINGVLDRVARDLGRL